MNKEFQNTNEAKPSLSNQNRQIIETILQSQFNYGKCSFLTGGMCGDIYMFDSGVGSFPQYTCVKVPKSIKGNLGTEASKRFLREINLQQKFFYNCFVHWFYDVDIIQNTLVASFRYWGNDLAKLIKENKASRITRLSLLLYTCIGLKHCYSRGLKVHQDLKPANIFIQDLSHSFTNLPDYDICNFAKIADFGLANASIEHGIYDGSRPYMAPEQWNKADLTEATDIFALGVIFYELMTNGYHPVGIKLSDFWPEPRNSNTKKWTKAEGWKKWINNNCPIKQLDDTEVEGDILEFIKKMIAVEPSARPNIDDVIDFIKNRIKDICHDTYQALIFLLDCHEKYYKQHDYNWPYLSEKLKTINNALNG